MHLRHLICCLFFMIPGTFAQLTPIGQWREHFPCREAIAVAAGSEAVFCATPYSLFSVSREGHEFTRYSKVNGLHDAGIAAIGWHETGAALVIAYRNSNLDVLHGENVVNIPEVMQRQTSGDKRIRHIAFSGGRALLSTGLGIIVLDLERNEIEDTWLPVLNSTVFSTATAGNTCYAATSTGVKSAPLQGSNLADQRNWADVSAGLPSQPMTEIGVSGSLLLGRVNDTVFSLQGGAWQKWYVSPAPIQSLSLQTDAIFVHQPGKTLRLSPEAAVLAEYSQPGLIVSPAAAVLTGNSAWIADGRNGLVLHENGVYESLVPNSPAGIATGDLFIHNNALWAASGGVNASWQPLGNQQGLYRFEQEEWFNYAFPLPYHDIVSLSASGSDVFAGSFGGGLLTLPASGNYTGTKPLGDSLISGIAADAEGYLWASSYGANGNLLVKRPDNTWQRFIIPIFHTANAVSQILIDDSNQKWIVSPGGSGVLVLNHGANVENTQDDQWKLFQPGAGRGNLPSGEVYCAAKDKDGWIWIGTARGIGVVQCAAETFATAGCDAIWPVVRQDNFAGYLFQNEKVNTIATDGANRKWVGTQNGAWLISADGTGIIQHFNTANSPLPDNVIHRIAIHPETGEVFFATAAGIISWRGTATEGTPEQGSNVMAFPNPVPHGYEGTIAIRGLVRNAIVKITDITGKLVYQTRAQGGQAVWNGKDYTGYRPQSGVYLVLASDDTGKEKIVTKLVFIR
ncbi:two-component regulator propeller domain-containing protein [Chitinophaga sp. GCM10012297]|uniref:T9SS type A sorting domain-containing protein n=1 Tax=Chitinophaga chungangae TaxID=2821488 RepID=A0ABS3YEV4_9BACT|nr:two-component regulator propeller domain-containing protein [Chitinophaga chungangae]MBO9152649.1 T9SS type A sorting domain-containing protein [Chitinophaga chungangae]